MPLVDSEAIVLRTYRLSEADKIVVCLTRTSGIVRAVAHGASRLRSRFGAGLEPFTLLQLCYYEKEGQELVSLRHIEIIQSYFELSVSREKVAAMSYMSQLVMEFMQPRDPNETVFRMVKSCLDAFANTVEEWRAVIRYFEVWILKLSGYLPEFRSCIDCRKLFTSEEPIFLDVEFKPQCYSCGKGLGTLLSSASLKQFNAVQRLNPREFALSASTAEPFLVEMARITYGLITRALDRQPGGHSKAV